MKTSPVVQKLQIRLRDKELPQGPPSLRRPRRCPTGPSRLGRRGRHNTARAAAPPPSRPSAGRADNAPLLARRDFASPPRGRTARCGSPHRRTPSGRSRRRSRAMAERGYKYLAAQGGQVAQRGRGDGTKLPPMHTHTTGGGAPAPHRRVRSALTVPAAPTPRPPGPGTSLIRWSHTHLPSPLQRVFKGIVHSSSPTAASPRRARGRRGHRGIVRHGRPGAAPAAAAVCQEREKMAAGARLSHSCAASCSGGARRNLARSRAGFHGGPRRTAEKPRGVSVGPAQPAPRGLRPPCRRGGEIAMFPREARGLGDAADRASESRGEEAVEVGGAEHSSRVVWFGAAGARVGAVAALRGLPGARSGSG